MRACICVCVCIYIYIERERERERMKKRYPGLDGGIKKDGGGIQGPMPCGKKKSGSHSVLIFPFLSKQPIITNLQGVEVINQTTMITPDMDES